jgi:TPP-dependent pyruvate/acetoin dehydrogenase alpha subunit
MADPDLYRAKEEIADWKKRDPIPAFIARLKADAVLDDAELAALETDVGNEIEWAVAEAENGAWEPLEDLTRDVYTARATGDG